MQKTVKRVKSMLSLFLAILMAFSAFPGAAAAAPVTGDPATDWNGAQWIWDSVTSDVPFTHDLWLMMRKSIDLEKAPDSAVAKISIDSRYWLYVNGELVIREGQQKNGPTPNAVYYDQEDLTPYFKEGKNVIAVYGNYWGRRRSNIISYSNYDTGQAGFVFDLDIDGTHVTSDGTWKVLKDPAHTQTSSRYGTYRLQECSAFHDARQEIPGWYLPDYDDSAWPNAIELGEAPCEPWGDMFLRRIPQFKDFGLKEYLNMDSCRNLTTTETTTLRMNVPHNSQLTPYLKVIDTEGGKTIDIVTDGMSALGATYITKASDEPQEWESFVWTNGQYVTYTVPAGVTVVSLQYRESGYNTEFTGYFRSDDEFLNELWTMSAQTLYVTMRDNFMDCPDRERAQWWGDTTNESHMSFYALDQASYDLYRSGVSTMIGWIDKDNENLDARDALRTVVPVQQYDRWTYELPMQQLAGVNGMWTYYMYTGEIDLLEEVYEPVVTYLAKWNMQDDGLAAHRLNSLIWDWPDWGSGHDMPVMENAWYYLCLGVAANMAGALGETEDLAWINARRESIKDAFEEIYWTGSCYMSENISEPDDRANAVAVLAGLASEEKYQSLIDNVFNTRLLASPYMEKYIEDAMFMMGYDIDGIERIRTRYGPLVGVYTTLNEHFDLSGSKNHAWSGGPLIAMSGYVTGVGPDEPGYEKWHVIPQLGGVNEIECRVPAVIGDIDVSIKKDNDLGTLQMTVSSPGKDAEFWVPVDDARSAVTQTSGPETSYLGIKEAYGKTYAVYSAEGAGTYSFFFAGPARIGVSANAITHYGDSIEYTFSAAGMCDFNLLDITFTMSGDTLNAAEAKLEGVNGFEVFQADEVKITPLSDGLWQCTAVLGVYSGDEKTKSGDTDFAKLSVEPAKLGDANVTLTSVKAFGIDMIDGAAESNERATQIDPALATSKVYSVYDVNADDRVDNADLSLAFYYYQSKEADVNWDSAKAADVNDDGKVDMVDLLAIYANYI